MNPKSPPQSILVPCPCEDTPKDTEVDPEKDSRSWRYSWEKPWREGLSVFGEVGPGVDEPPGPVGHDAETESAAPLICLAPDDLDC